MPSDVSDERSVLTTTSRQAKSKSKDLIWIRGKKKRSKRKSERVRSGKFLQLALLLNERREKTCVVSIKELP